MITKLKIFIKFCENVVLDWFKLYGMEAHLVLKEIRVSSDLSFDIESSNFDGLEPRYTKKAFEKI